MTNSTDSLLLRNQLANLQESRGDTSTEDSTPRDETMNEDQVSERTLTGQAQFLDGTVSVREVLNFIESDRYMDLKEVTEYLPLSERTIRDHLNEIPHFRYGKKIIFRRSELDRWMEGFRVRDQDLDQAMKMAEQMLA